MTENYLVPPRSSPVAGTVMIAAGAVLVAAGAYDLVLVVARGSMSGGILQAIFPLLAGALLVAVGDILRARKGGVSVDRARGRLLVHGVRATDALEVPLTALSRLRLVHRDAERQEGTVRLWSAEVETASGAAILLGESPQHAEALAFLRHLGESLPCPVDEEEPPQPPQPAAAHAPPGVRTATADGVRYRFKVGTGSALSWALPLFGGAALILGVALMLRVEDNPLSGFLVGPTLGMLGAVLLALSAGKASADEELAVGPGGAAHRFLVLGRRVGERTLALGGPQLPYARVRPRGAKGASVEIVGQSHVLVAATGVTARSRGLDYSGMLALTSSLTADLRRFSGAAR